MSCFFFFSSSCSAVPSAESQGWLLRLGRVFVDGVALFVVFVFKISHTLSLSLLLFLSLSLLRIW
jgi:hypothetical protein